MQLDCKSDPLNAKCLSAKYLNKAQTTLPSIKLDDREQSENEVETTSTTSMPISVSTKKSYQKANENRFNYSPASNRNLNDLDQNYRTRKPLIQQKYGDLSTTISNDVTSTIPSIFVTDTDLPFPTDRSIIDILTFKPPKSLDSVKQAPNQSFKDVDETSASNEQPLICKLGKLDPRCPNPTPTATPPTYLPPSTTNLNGFTTVANAAETTTIEPTQKTAKKFFICVPGSNDVRCDINALETTQGNDLLTFTTESLSQVNRGIDIRVGKPNCKIDSNNPECRKVQTDILSLKSRTTTISPTTGNREANTEIPSTTYKQIPTTTVNYPYPQYTTKNVIPIIRTTDRVAGVATSELPSISRSTTTSIPLRTQTYNQFTTITNQPVCYPGALDPRCLSSTTQKPIFPSTTNRVITYGTRTTPSTPITQTYNQFTMITNPPVCYPGALDPRCQSSTTKKPIFPPRIGDTDISNEIPSTPSYNQFSTSVKPSICYPGALDVRCQFSTTKQPIPTINAVKSTSKYPLGCYSGKI